MRSFKFSGLKAAVLLAAVLAIFAHSASAVDVQSDGMNRELLATGLDCWCPVVAAPPPPFSIAPASEHSAPPPPVTSFVPCACPPPPPPDTTAGISGGPCEILSYGANCNTVPTPRPAYQTTLSTEFGNTVKCRFQVYDQCSPAYLSCGAQPVGSKCCAFGFTGYYVGYTSVTDWTTCADPGSLIASDAVIYPDDPVVTDATECAGYPAYVELIEGEIYECCVFGLDPFNEGFCAAKPEGECTGEPFAVDSAQCVSPTDCGLTAEAIISVNVGSTFQVNFNVSTFLLNKLKLDKFKDLEVRLTTDDASILSIVPGTFTVNTNTGLGHVQFSANVETAGIAITLQLWNTTSDSLGCSNAEFTVAIVNPCPCPTCDAPVRRLLMGSSTAHGESENAIEGKARFHNVRCSTMPYADKVALAKTFATDLNSKLGKPVIVSSIMCGTTASRRSEGGQSKWVLPSQQSMMVEFAALYGQEDVSAEAVARAQVNAGEAEIFDVASGFASSQGMFLAAAGLNHA